MTRSLGAPVSLVAHSDRGALKLSFYELDNPKPTLETWTDLDEEGRKALWWKVRQRLEQFRARLGQGVKDPRGVKVDDWRVLSEAVHDLHRLGQWLASTLFGPRNVPAVTRLFREAYPAWDDPSGPAGLIEVRAPNHDMVPIEFIPVFGMSLPLDPIKDIRRLTEVSRFFPGFATVVKRQIASVRKLPQASDLFDNEQRLPVKLFYHGGFPGARDELRFFSENDCFVLKGHWPRGACNYSDCLSDGCKSADAAAVLARHLWNPTLGFRCSELTVPDQVLHFSCHCHFEHSDDPETLCLTFSPDGKEMLKVTVEELKQRLVEYAREGLKDSLPLVFLNACGTGASASGFLPALPYLFLVDIGNRGFIGTQTLIPDLVAAEFSRRFYYHLLLGRTLGLAFYEAKQDLLKRHRNPMGILYSAYANPDLRVSQPVKRPLKV
jgi:hypothetical protein